MKIYSPNSLNVFLTNILKEKETSFIPTAVLPTVLQASRSKAFLCCYLVSREECYCRGHPHFFQWLLYVPPGLTFTPFCPHSVFMCFVWISEQTAIISLYSINWLVFITETECAYCAVRAGSLNKTQTNCCFKSLDEYRNLNLWIENLKEKKKEGAKFLTPISYFLNWYFFQNSLRI
jgi:hypothetical protein